MFQDYKVAYLRERVTVKEKRHLSFLRQSVAYFLSQSARKIPHAAFVNTFDVTPLIDYTRGSTPQDANDSSEEALFKRALRKNYSAFFLKAVAHALYHVPSMNGFIDYHLFRNGGTLYVADDINLSFTVHTKFGVLKPILRNPHQRTLEEVAHEMRDLARRARRTDANQLYQRAGMAYVKTALRQFDLSGLGALWILLRSFLWARPKPDPELAQTPLDKQLKVEEILGATCTLANVGMMAPGHQTVTVIIPPEVMMFGLGDLHQEPRVIHGEVVPRYVVTMCGSMDHRAMDGGEAFPFVNHFQRYMDNPALIYEWQPGDEV